VSILKVNNITKSFGKKQILNNISFECCTGEIIGIFGRNGSGKSTLLKIIHGTLKSDSIDLSINSNPINPLKVIPQKKIGFLPQDSFLPKGLTVRQAIPLLFENGDNQDKIFYSPGVSKFEKQKIGALSIGELRYLEVLLICNLSHPFILLDEPFSMIAPLYKDLIKTVLLSLKETKGIIITDHYYTDVLDITDCYFLIKNSKKIIISDTSDLMNNGYLNKNN
jgi:ABC-type lipopolysaccharide export system ATPase subunit